MPGIRRPIGLGVALMSVCAAVHAQGVVPSVTKNRSAAVTQPQPASVADLATTLYADDVEASEAAQSALLCMPLEHDELVELAGQAGTPEQLAAARDIARHHVLSRLREEELADLEDDSVIIGFQFTPQATAGQIGRGTGEIVERYPYGAQVTTTTPGFPGYAYLRPGDMIVGIGGESFPTDTAAAQQFLIDSVKAHALGESVEMTVVRAGELLELTVPLARAAALPAMYDARTVTRDLIDPFLFLWEEAWSTIRLDAGYDEDAAPIDNPPPPVLRPR